MRRLGFKISAGSNMSRAAMPAAIVLGMAGAFPVPVLAAQPVGQTVKVQNLVSASTGNRQLSVSDPVYGDEKVTSGPDSLGELQLNDNSKVLIGENSTISLDDFVVSGDTFGNASVNIVKGAFRFVSGNSAKGVFRVSTPVSSIGVRGTFFDVYVGDNGETRVALLNGQIDVCNRQRNCISVTRGCDVVFVGADGSISREPYVNSRERSPAAAQAQLPLMGAQNRYSRGYKAPLWTCSARAALDITPGNGDPEKAEQQEQYEYTD